MVATRSAPTVGNVAEREPRGANRVRAWGLLGSTWGLLGFTWALAREKPSSGAYLGFLWALPET
eukprot:4537549-Alexandrium_andersonii.AAC.1